MHVRPLANLLSLADFISLLSAGTAPDPLSLLTSFLYFITVIPCFSFTVGQLSFQVEPLVLTGAQLESFVTDPEEASCAFASVPVLIPGVVSHHILLRSCLLGYWV